MTSVTNPDGFSRTTAYNNFGTLATQHVRTNNSLGLWTESYFDGFGRVTKNKSKGPDTTVVVTDTEYNIRGAVKRTSLPYFESGGSPSWRTPVYDPLGRVTEATNPDDTVTKACYDDWVTVGLDVNSHRKRETRDAYGRLIKVEEYTGTFGTCDTSVGSPYATTTYQYDVLGNLRFVTDAKSNQSESSTTR